MLAPLGFDVVTLDDVPDAIEVVEDGDSFAANAALEGDAAGEALGPLGAGGRQRPRGRCAGGAPGIYSARFAGPNATDDDNNRKSARADLTDMPLEKRTAHYVCHVTVADPTGTIRAESEDICRGRIRFEPAGTNGFGYDPLSRSSNTTARSANLGPHVKQALSHRSRALRAIVPQALGT